MIVVSGDPHKFCWPKGFRIEDPNAEGAGVYLPWSQFCQTKLANILFAVELHRRLNSPCFSGVSVFPLQPGIHTEINRDESKLPCFNQKILG